VRNSVCKEKDYLKGLFMTKIDLLIKEISSQEAFEIGSITITPEMIESAEESLSIHFTDDYKYFLKKYGYLSWIGNSILGISDDEDYDTVFNTNEIREMELPEDFQSIPLEGNIVMNYAGGGYYFLYSLESEKANSVELFTDESGGQSVKVWKTFADFIDHVKHFK
jgi:antitoxin YobK